MRDESVSQLGMSDTLGDRLRQALKEKGMSARALSKAIGSSPGTIDAIIQGRSKNPEGPRLGKISEVTGYTVQWLLTGEGPRKNSETAPKQPVVEAEGRPDVETALNAQATALADLDPEVARSVIKAFREEHFRGVDTMPSDYWPARLKKLIAEATGRAKDVPQREPAMVADLTEESPEIQAARKKPRRM